MPICPTCATPTTAAAEDMGGTRAPGSDGCADCARAAADRAEQSLADARARSEAAILAADCLHESAGDYLRAMRALSRRAQRQREAAAARLADARACDAALALLARQSLARDDARPAPVAADLEQAEAWR